MDKYKACNDLSSTISSKINIVWANKQIFAKQYQVITKLPIKTCLNILTGINKSYPITWYHTKGFVFSVDLLTKVEGSKFTVDWGKFYILFHIDYPRDLFVVGGNFKENYYNAIHPNIYKKLGYDIYVSSCRICLHEYVKMHTLTTLINSGNLHSYLDEVIGYVRSNDGNGLFDRFYKIAYDLCRYCGDFVNKNEIICDNCTEKQ